MGRQQTLGVPALGGITLVFGRPLGRPQVMIQAQHYIIALLFRRAFQIQRSRLQDNAEVQVRPGWYSRPFQNFRRQALPNLFDVLKAFDDGSRKAEPVADNAAPLCPFRRGPQESHAPVLLSQVELARLRLPPPRMLHDAHAVAQQLLLNLVDNSILAVFCETAGPGNSLQTDASRGEPEQLQLLAVSQVLVRVILYLASDNVGQPVSRIQASKRHLEPHCLEVGCGLPSWPRVHQFSSEPEQNYIVEHVEDGDSGLVQDADDGEAQVGELPKNANDLMRPGTIEAGCRFIKKQHPRVSNQLYANVDPLPLATADAPLIGVANSAVSYFIKVQ
mmetsp:Transcript_29334/g.55415  ORF Transcript_29334/g.55415 Transcript_29334/m.55415 type:complete len:333 (-) Transcript_29334:888-1886(-)